MDDRSETHPGAASPTGPPDRLGAASHTTAALQLARDACGAVLRDELEVWLNEGGAGDEPWP